MFALTSFRMAAAIASLASLYACASSSEGDGSGLAGGDPTAGTGAGVGASGTAAPNGTGAGGTGVAPTAGAAAGVGVSGTGASGTGVGGVGASGTGVAGIGASGTGAGGIGSSGTGAGGIGASGTGAGGMGASGTGASGTGASGMGASGMGAPPLTNGECCADGNCICRGDDPQLTSRDGPYRVDSFAAGLDGTIFYPTDADPPLAGLAIIPGFLNSGPEMQPWCQFYASHGIVCAMTNSLPTDFPDIRGTKLLAAVEAMKAANMDSSSPLFEKMSGRYATSGYSMGGGGTTIASGSDPTLMASVGLAAWGGVGQGVMVPTLLLCGSADTVAACVMSSAVYSAIPAATPRMQVTCSGLTHFNWFGPTDCSGPYALAFMKRFLEGDERYGPLLKENVSGGTVNDTNIQ